jgi:hypothetical protein
MPALQHSHAECLHVSLNGCLVEHERWERRRAEAARLVDDSLLTVLEASEHFGLPADEIRALKHHA